MYSAECLWKNVSLLSKDLRNTGLIDVANHIALDCVYSLVMASSTFNNDFHDNSYHEDLSNRSVFFDTRNIWPKFLNTLY